MATFPYCRAGTLGSVHGNFCAVRGNRGHFRCSFPCHQFSQTPVLPVIPALGGLLIHFQFLPFQNHLHPHWHHHHHHCKVWLPSGEAILMKMCNFFGSERGHFWVLLCSELGKAPRTISSVFSTASGALVVGRVRDIYIYIYMYPLDTIQSGDSFECSME